MPLQSIQDTLVLDIYCEYRYLLSFITMAHFWGNNYHSFNLIFLVAKYLHSTLSPCHTVTLSPCHTVTLSHCHRCWAIKFNFISDKPVISLTLGLGIDQEKITGNLSSWLSFFFPAGLCLLHLRATESGSILKDWELSTRSSVNWEFRINSWSNERRREPTGKYFVSEGSDLYLECKVHSRPVSSDVFWMKDVSTKSARR